MIAEACVTGEINVPVFTTDDVTAPEGFIAVEKSAAREMHGRNAVNRRCANISRNTPFEFIYGFNLFGAQQAGYACGDDECGAAVLREPSKSWKIQMIVMIVAEKHDVNAREIFPVDSGISFSPRPDPGKRAGALRPDWI